ncbi:MAG: hypothetical protein QOJ94_1597 [Sphingomonadales bacterium]|jgi:hypothetical protein|nr:hypothetical protein [Sphingomonadales bacterium]
MSNRNDRASDRADTARRTDDSDVIDPMEGGPDFGGSSAGNLQRDIGGRDEMHIAVDDGDQITRVRDSDKPEQANLPRFNRK